MLKQNISIFSNSFTISFFESVLIDSLPTLKKFRNIGFDLGNQQLKWYFINSLCTIKEQNENTIQKHFLLNDKSMNHEITNQFQKTKDNDIYINSQNIQLSKPMENSESVHILKKRYNKQKNSSFQNNLSNNDIFDNDNYKQKQNRQCSYNEYLFQENDFLQTKDFKINKKCNNDSHLYYKKRDLKFQEKNDFKKEQYLSFLQRKNQQKNKNSCEILVGNKNKKFAKAKFDKDRDLYINCVNCNQENYIDISEIPIEEIFQYKYRLNTNIFLQQDLTNEEKEKLLVNDISKQYNKYKLNKNEIPFDNKFSSTNDIIMNLKQYVEEDQQQENNDIKYNYQSTVQPSSYPNPDKEKKNSIFIKKAWGFIKVNFDSIQIQGNICKKSIWLELIAFHQIYTGQNKFGAILMDPAWPQTAIKFKYTITEDKQWMNAFNLANLQQNGLIFIWITNSKLQASLDYMKENGYQQIEVITWVKLKENYDLKKGIDYYLLHCTEHCVVGIKEEKYEKIINQFNSFKSKINILKPDELYKIIESLIPN